MLPPSVFRLVILGGEDFIDLIVAKSEEGLSVDNATVGRLELLLPVAAKFEEEAVALASAVGAIAFPLVPTLPVTAPTPETRLVGTEFTAPEAADTIKAPGVSAAPAIAAAVAPTVAPALFVLEKYLFLVPVELCAILSLDRSRSLFSKSN